MKSNLISPSFLRYPVPVMKLEDYESQFLAILNQVTVGTAQIGLDGRLSLVNPVFCELLGYSLEELTNRSIHDLLPIGDCEQESILLDQLFESSTSAAITNHLSPTILQRFLHKSGNWIELELTLHTVCDSIGIPKYFIAVLQSLTPQNRFGYHLSEKKHLVDVAPVAIFVQDFDHRILFWNQGAENLYGWKQSERIGHSTHDLYPENSSDLDVALLSVMKTGTWQGVLKQQTRSHQEIIVQSCWTIIGNNNQETQCILVVNTDITQQKQQTAQTPQAQRLESLNMLAGGIVHHLSNLLTPVLATAQLLPIKFPDADHRTQQLMELLEVNAKRATKLIQHVLLLAGKSEPQRLVINVENSLVDMMQLLQATLPKSIGICVEINTLNLGAVEIDPTHWNCMLLNLCLNAYDAMPHGGMLTLAAHTKTVHENDRQKPNLAKAGSYIAISVTDTGCGIATDILDRIFDPFFTTKPSRNGLGLSLVNGIATSHGGWVSVCSKVGKGSTVTLYLPQVPRHPNRALPILEQNLGSGEMILLVDDEMSLQVLTKMILEDHHYQVVTARNGFEAIEQYLKHRDQIKVILMDVMMLTMGGVTAIDRLQLINPDVKIIATSGLESNCPAEIEVSKRVEAFLLKPYTAQELLKILKDVTAMAVV